jgi:WD40 repeat protein
MKTVLPSIAILLPLLTLLSTGFGFGPTRGEAAVPSDDVPEQPGDPTIECAIAPEEDSGAITCLAFSPDGKALAAGNAGGMLRVYDPDTARQVASARVMKRTQGGCRALAFTPDDQILAETEYTLGEVSLLKPITGRPVRAMEHPPFRPGRGIWTLAISPDGRVVAAGYGSGDVVLWDAATGRRLRVLPPYIIPAHVEGPLRKPVLAQAAAIGGLAFAPDGATLYSTGGLLRAWNVASGEERTRFDKPENQYLGHVVVAPDGTTVATGDRGNRSDERAGTISLWETATGRPRLELPTTESILGLAYLPGGRTLVALEAGNVVRLWDVTSARLVAALRFDHHFRAQHLAVARDGRRIAVGGCGNGSALIFGKIYLLDTDGVTLRLHRPKT